MPRVLGQINTAPVATQTPSPTSGRTLGAIPAPAVTTTPPLDATTKADTATFPATGSESPLGIAAKTIGNIPSSAVGFAKGVFDFLNPLNTVNTIKEIGTSAAAATKEGDIGQIAKDTLYGLPKAAFKTVVPQFIQHIVAGKLDKAAATLENDPVGQIAPLIFIARAAAVKAGVGPQFDSAVTSIASPVTNSVASAAKTVKNVAVGAGKFASSQLTGLSPTTLEQVTSNPQEFSKQAQSTVTRPALAASVNDAIQGRQSELADTGAGYSGIRTQTEPIAVSGNYLDSLIKDTTGLDIKNGKLTPTGSSSIRLPSDVNALQTKIYNLWAPEFAKGYITPEQFLNLRSDLSKMVYNDSGIGKSTDLANLSSIMRAKLNTQIRPQIPGLEQIDKTFAPQVTELKQLSQGLVDKQGNLTDSAINRIANATGKGKDPMLARLEALSPGITDKIKILKAVEDIQNSRENKPGTYTRAAVGVGGLVTLNPFLIVSAMLSLPEIAVPLMRGLGYSQELISKTINTLGIKENLSAINKLQVPPILKTILKNSDVSAGLAIKDVSGIPPELAPLAKEAQKYKTTLNIQNKEDLAYLGRIFSEDTIAKIKNGEMTNWRGENYQDLAKVNIVSHTPQTMAQELAGRIKPYKLDSNTVFHGTSPESAVSIKNDGFKVGSSLKEDAFRGGGYDARQNSISFSTDPIIASNFTGTGSKGSLITTSIKPSAKVVTIKGIDYAEDLNKYVKELRKQGVDAVYLEGEKEVAVINKAVIDKITDVKNFDVINKKSQLTDFYNKVKGVKATNK